MYEGQDLGVYLKTLSSRNTTEINNGIHVDLPTTGRSQVALALNTLANSPTELVYAYNVSPLLTSNFNNCQLRRDVIMYDLPRNADIVFLNTLCVHHIDNKYIESIECVVQTTHNTTTTISMNSVISTISLHRSPIHLKFTFASDAPDNLQFTITYMEAFLCKNVRRNLALSEHDVRFGEYTCKNGQILDVGQNTTKNNA
jgi:hypothetical protein